MLFPLAVFGQEQTQNSGTTTETPIIKPVKKFNDWAISAGAGVPILNSSDLKSLEDGNNLYGYSAYLSIDKAISHAFGLNLQYDKGETKQGLADANNDFTFKGNTQYDAISLLGDVNLSNLWRRVDTNTPFRWALHGYAGLGTLGYKSFRQDVATQSQETLVSEIKPFSLNSLFGQAGAGLKYNISRLINLEGRVMYVMTGDDAFDASTGTGVNDINTTSTDNFINATLGVSLTLGKHQSHLMWHDPLKEIYYKLDVQDSKNLDIVVCKKGDGDNDGVCDDWDRQLDTPLGARVDGAGVSLDADLDGVIDLNDKCVTLAGPVENNGCPENLDKIQKATEIELALKDILFDFNKATIRPESYSKLDLAAHIIKESNGGTYLLTGHTDKKGSDTYNLDLSKKRAAAVVAALEKRGINSIQLKSRGVGEAEATMPETASDLERIKDRRVEVTFVEGDAWKALPKNDL